MEWIAVKGKFALWEITAPDGWLIVTGPNVGVKWTEADAIAVGQKIRAAREALKGA